MLVWDTAYLRKIRAMEIRVGDAVPVLEGGNIIADYIQSDQIPSRHLKKGYTA